MRRVIPRADSAAARTLIAAAGWAALPAALAALALVTAVLTSIGLLPVVAMPLVVMAILVVAIVWMVRPTGVLRRVPERICQRYSVSTEERMNGFVLFAVCAVLAGLIVYLII